MKYKIPKYAKRIASRALMERAKLPKYKQFGLTKSEAMKKGINSGVERAKQIVRSDYLERKDALRVSAFYNRFKGCNTPKCEGAIDLWGGRRFGRVISDKLKGGK